MTPAQQQPPSRPLWFLGPGGMPVRSTKRSIPKGATHQAYEGDASWTFLGDPGAIPERPAGATE